jgi:hypothetical protein
MYSLAHLLGLDLRKSELAFMSCLSCCFDFITSPHYSELARLLIKFSPGFKAIPGGALMIVRALMKSCMHRVWWDKLAMGLGRRNAPLTTALTKSDRMLQEFLSNRKLNDFFLLLFIGNRPPRLGDRFHSLNRHVIDILTFHFDTPFGSCWKLLSGKGSWSYI